jgi:SpoVK/Ycf46/Vps4 family AAA+-type ATPase
MATADQIKALIRSHWSEEPERFFTTALQVAAHEARQGHGALATEIKDMVDEARRQDHRSKILSFPVELEGLISREEPRTALPALVLSKALEERITKVLREYRQRDKLRVHNLSPRRKLLLTGPPGTGKTMTARVLAHEIRLPLYTVLVDKMVTRFMGETSAKLRLIFEQIARTPGVYLLDEFDAIGGCRSLDNDVGEMRRVLNSLLQFIEQDHSDSLILGATNTPNLLDHALFRRFDDVLTYQFPGEKERLALIKNMLGVFLGNRFGWKSVLEVSKGLSHAEIDLACRDAMKDAILADRETVTGARLTESFGERKGAQKSS